MTLPWESSFREGIEAFRLLEFREALERFDVAISEGGEYYMVYDSRAAVYEKIGKIKDALKDSRKVIELAPHMRHGFTRSARLLLALGKHDNALKMVQLALDRVKTKDTIHCMELEALRQAILDAKDALVIKDLRKRAHIFKLPVELISEIFVLSAETDIGSPVCVSLVCSLWREMALSVSALWKRIALSNIRPVRKLQLWQERSKGRITSLLIRAGISRVQLQDTFARCKPDFFKTLQCFHCEVDLPLISKCLITVPTVSELDLENIRISVSSHLQTDSIALPMVPLIPSTRTSSVQSLVVEYVNVEWTKIVPHLIHLHTLVIRTSFVLPSAALLFILLEANTHLEEVTLETGLSWELDTAGTDRRSALPHLSSLELLGPIDAGRMIARLSLPNIKRLVISQCLRAADEAIFALDPLPALTELSIRKCSFSERQLASVLQCMQNLTKLEITHSGSQMDIIVDAIAGVHDGSSGRTTLICPRLRHVDFSHSTNLNGGPIVRLVKPRLQPTVATGSPTTKLDVLLIDGCPRVDPSVPEWLRSKVEVVSCVYMSKKDIRNLSRRMGVYQ